MEQQSNIANVSFVPQPALTIFDSNTTEVLRIENDGSMMWRPQGSTELQPLDVDKDLPLAFALCVEMLSGVPHKMLLHDVRTKAVQSTANTIAAKVAQYLINIKLVSEEHRAIHEKNVNTIVNGVQVD